MSEGVRIIRIQQPEYLDVLALRNEVLRKPLGLNIYHENLDHELDAQIFIYQTEGKVVGCLLLFPEAPQVVRFKQMAVAPAYQGRGIGRALIKAAEDFALSKGFSNVYFHARESAIPFYEKMGYSTFSDSFTEVGIPHKKMGRNLAGQAFQLRFEEED